MLGLWEKRDALDRADSKGDETETGHSSRTVHDPEVLFMDEPNSEPYSEASKAVREFILDLKKEKKTIFINTHNLDEAQRVCHRIGILNTRLMVVGILKNLNGQSMEGRQLSSSGR